MCLISSQTFKFAGRFYRQPGLSLDASDLRWFSSGRYAGLYNALITEEHTGNDACIIFLSNREIWSLIG